MNKFPRAWELFFLALIFGLSWLLIWFQTWLFSSGTIPLTDYDPQEFVTDAFRPAAFIIFGVASSLAFLWWVIAALWNDNFHSSKDITKARFIWFLLLLGPIVAIGVSLLIYQDYSDGVLWFPLFLIINIIINYYLATAISTPEFLLGAVPLASLLQKWRS